MASPKLPSMISADAGHFFRFYLGGQLQEGLRYDNKLYGLSDRFSVHQSVSAYRCALAWSEKGIPGLVQEQGNGYVVWVEMVSSLHHPLVHGHHSPPPSDPSLQAPDPALTTLPSIFY